MTNSKRASKSILDITPWPQGLGFADAEVWWTYILAQPEADRLNHLLAAALLSEEISALLLHRERALLERFSLSTDTQKLLLEIDAATLNEFAQILLMKLGRRQPDSSAKN